jgi:hypothetical protein
LRRGNGMRDLDSGLISVVLISFFLSFVIQAFLGRHLDG